MFVCVYVLISTWLPLERKKDLLTDVYSSQAIKVEELGKVDFESEKQKRNKAIFVPSWFTVDLKTGVSRILSTSTST